MSPKPEPRSEKLAVLYEGRGDILPFRELAERLAVPLLHAAEVGAEDERLYLSWREGCLKLLDKELLKKGGLSVDIEPRQGEQRSWPAPKQNILAQAIGRRTRTVIDATSGWGQDSLAIFRMGYDLLCLERSSVMAELLADGFRRLVDLDWMRRLQLEPPRLLIGDAITLLSELTSRPDCIYLDPMFPPKRKKSALTRKSMALLHDLVGEDTDKEQLFAAAFRATGKRVVVKSPDYAEPLGGKPTESLQGKLLRYDVYLKDSN
ncbi:MAG: class I SAM-dependent methyltransferase [Methylosarcina sp.]